MNLSCALGASIFAFLGPTGWVVATNGVFFHIFFQTSSVVRLFDTATNGILIFYYNWKTSDFRVHALSALAMSVYGKSVCSESVAVGVCERRSGE